MLQWMEEGCGDIFQRNHAGESTDAITGIGTATGQ